MSNKRKIQGIIKILKTKQDKTLTTEKGTIAENKEKDKKGREIWEKML